MSHQIAKTAVDRENFFEPALFYQSAREGMRDFLTNVLPESHDGVLLPAFIGWSPNEGSGVFDPVGELGNHFGFYDLNPDLTADLEDLERNLSTGRYRVLVLIHYFGRTEPALSRVSELAQQYDVLLLEDLAHGFFSSVNGKDAGSFGQVRLFSLHKMFPLTQGGLITYSSQTLVKGQKSTMAELAVDIMSYNWDAIAAIRRANFAGLTERLKSLPEFGGKFQLLWPELGALDVPQTLPVRIFGDSRDNIYKCMNEDGLGMVSLYHTLIDHVRRDFDSMMDLSRHIINFPVHQDVRPESLDFLVSAFQARLND
ncbi:DegT/DnrJ/EryC1/StrS family aminotransferase [Pseudarthrobacter sp. H3Y2-7]|uniref:DegT/DnrJ/EryC1/StrS family aminotransferase n=1 Tax=Pseudarthrobacter naphthalenicus TaxID=3031328 RepID=UPI0023B1583B|nr:DegT/DnrJ/EryC1/StrS family aminotransferase [Pseudarthrobacter sp. H3Y2-7]MDE8668152.1 DegT/DnrJ/EryC1/StrS family aminotransferase [Pseudarthrobacter sp. H3Y2-7]